MVPMKHPRMLALAAVLVVVAAALLIRVTWRAPERAGQASPVTLDATGPAASPECNAAGRERVTSYQGRWTSRINDPDPPSDRTYDLRALRHVGYGSSTRYAITLANPGSGWTAARQCVLGGTVLSSVDPDRTWEDLERNYNGDALDVGVESD
jgi:hypothetical protein